MVGYSTKEIECDLVTIEIFSEVFAAISVGIVIYSLN